MHAYFGLMLIHIWKGLWRNATKRMCPPARYSMVYGSSNGSFYIATGRGFNDKYYNDIWTFDIRYTLRTMYTKSAHETDSICLYINRYPAFHPPLFMNVWSIVLYGLLLKFTISLFPLQNGRMDRTRENRSEQKVMLWCTEQIHISRRYKEIYHVHLL